MLRFGRGVMNRGIFSDWHSIVMFFTSMPRGSVIVAMRLQFISDWSHVMWVVSLCSVPWVNLVSHSHVWPSPKVGRDDDSWSIIIDILTQRSDNIVLLLRRSSPVKFLIELLH